MALASPEMGQGAVSEYDNNMLSYAIFAWQICHSGESLCRGKGFWRHFRL